MLYAVAVRGMFGQAGWVSYGEASCGWPGRQGRVLVGQECSTRQAGRWGLRLSGRLWQAGPGVVSTAG